MKARDNPFRSERIDALGYRAEGFNWEALEARLESFGGRGAIVGPEGHGKTTLLREWQGRCRAAGHEAVLVKMELGQRRLTSWQREVVATAAWIFLDSAEQLGWWGWRELRRLTSAARLLVVTSHRAGRLPTLVRCRTSPQLLGELVRELSGEDRECRALWDEHRGNVRHALRALYDAAAG